MEPSSGKVEKRNRPSLSCEPCRTRKLKCDRGSPCESCVKRAKESSCRYAANANRSKTGLSKQHNVGDRLKNLEELVSSFLTENVVLHPRKPTDDEDAADDLEVAPVPSKRSGYTPERNRNRGTFNEKDALELEAPRVLQSRGGQTHYIDSSHWLSILEDIQEVREQLAPTDGPVDADVPRDTVGGWEPDASFVFGFNQTPEIQEILSSLPSQPICDRLISQYFNYRYMILGYVHPTKFQGEYEKFWEAPTKAPILWIALLFAMLSITSQLRQVANTAKESDEMIPPTKVLQQRTAQCLVVGRYATANAYALEAFLLHLQSCFLGDMSPKIHLWFEMGTIIRLAFRMGYHRDPSNLPSISPFDGEMRRRVWLHIFQIDALTSFQIGSPSMIPTEYCDTQVPRNLEYSDLSVDMKSLPLSRPLSENTPVLYSIVKAGVMGVFKKIVAHTQSLASPTYDKTLALDLEIREVYSKVPELYQRRDVNRSFMDSSSLILERCTIELLYLKGTVVLHRRYISYHPEGTRYEYSRRACVEAALNILARQADLHQASQPGGRLYEEQWMVASLMPLAMHDFLLAAMVVCLELSVRMLSKPKEFMSVRGEQDFMSRESRALQTAQQIWAANRSLSSEARTASLALDLMSKKVAKRTAKDSSQYAAPSMGTAPALDSELPYAEPISEMIDGNENLDWNLLDQYFQNSGMETTYQDPWDIDLSLFPDLPGLT